MLHERGLAYQAKSLVNYDPVDQTVLANEQVDANGCSWRSGAKVEKLMLKQWFLKIKEYQEPLLDDMKALAKNGQWPEKVLAMQKHWIGKPESKGTKLWFDIESKTGSSDVDTVDVFTTRADTLFGAQYIALSLNHPIVQQSALGDASLRTFIERAPTLPSDTKEGYLLQDVMAHNPIAEAMDGVEARIPIYVAPYVLDDYGSGAVMGVPGHDTRDHAFWRANAGDEPIKVVITSEPGVIPEPLVPGGDDKPMLERGYVAANVKRYEGIPSHDAVQAIIDELHSLGKRAGIASNWRLRDWLISRQRYWGTPIPIIHCSSCGAVPVPEPDLPVKLPNLPDSFFDGRKGNPLAEDEHWKKTECPKCGSAAERETDTMDTFMDSSWYFFRFLDPKNESALVDPAKANEGMPVDLYVGGIEHAILHLLYARFISKFLASTATWPQGKLVAGEPFKKLITQGMVHGRTFTDPVTGRFLRPDEVDTTVPSAPLIKANNHRPDVSFEKMSKSKHNGVDPGETIAKHGADATRAHMLFQAPVGDVLEWDIEKITGVKRWLHKVIKLSSATFVTDDKLYSFALPGHQDLTLVQILQALQDRGLMSLHGETSQVTPQQLLRSLSGTEKKFWIKTQRIIASVTESYSQTHSLNTIISDLMTLTKTIESRSKTSGITPYLLWYSTAHLIRMIAPIAPGVAEEAWYSLTRICHQNLAIVESTHRPLVNHPTVFAAGFPLADLAVINRLTDTFKCVVQVDGKRKFEVEIEKNSSGNNTRFVLDQLLQTEPGKEWLSMETGKIWRLSSSKKPHPTHEVVPDDWKVIVVNDGKVVNLVGSKSDRARKQENQAVSTKPSPQVSQESKRRQDVHGLNNSSNEGSQISQPTTATQGQQNSISKSSPPAPSENLTLEEVHARVKTLMATLPKFLKLHCIPTTLIPVPYGTIRVALRDTNRDPDLPIYKYLFDKSWPTPPTVAQEHIIAKLDSDFPSQKREHLFIYYHAVFPDQLSIIYNSPSTLANRSILNKKLRYAIRFKYRKYKEKFNKQLRARLDRASGNAELNSALGMQDEGEDVSANDQPAATKTDKIVGPIDLPKNAAFITKVDAENEVKRIEKVWEEIIRLWASGAQKLDDENVTEEAKAVSKARKEWRQKFKENKQRKKEMKGVIRWFAYDKKRGEPVSMEVEDHWTWLAEQGVKDREDKQDKSGEAKNQGKNDEEGIEEEGSEWTWLVG